MNYIEFLNQFWQVRRARGMSAYEADLYYYLLNECNKRMWLNPFELPTSIICAEISISRKALVDLRNRLSQRGLIRFKEGCRNTKGATYELLHVTLSNILGNMNSSIEGNMPGNPIKNKLNKTKQEYIDDPMYEKFLLFEKWVDENTPTVGKMKEPLTFEQFKAIRNEYSYEFIQNLLINMHNWRDLTKKRVSANLTFRQWANKNR